MSMGFDRGNLPLSETAQHLLKSAEKYVNDETIGVDIWHILLAALTDPDITAYHILKRNINENRYQSLISHVKNRVQDPPSGHTWSLDIYLQACSEVAREEYNVEIDDSLILWQIVQKNLSVSSLFLSHGIDARQLQQSLQEAISIHPSTQPLMPLRLPRESIPALAIPEIWRNVIPVFLTRDLLDSTPLKQINHNMHSVTMNSLAAALTSISTIRRDHVLMFTGANGSAIDYIEYLLAYWIGQTEPTLPTNPYIPDLLSGYKLCKVSLSHFCDLARRRRLSLNALLTYLKQQVRQQKAILLLTELENIPYDGATGRKIREQLSHPDNVCIIGCWMYNYIMPSEEEQRFGLDNVIPISAEIMDDKTQFYDFIREHHLSRWAEQGYTVDNTTFDSLFILEKGIWIFRKRKTWPYLGIDLVDDCIRTVQKGKQSIRSLALDARIAISNVLTKEALEVEDALRTEFDPTLQAVQQRIGTLCENQDLPLKDGYTVISQSMMEAQLFCRNNSEYHYPGIHP